VKDETIIAIDDFVNENCSFEFKANPFKLDQSYVISRDRAGAKPGRVPIFSR